VPLLVLIANWFQLSFAEGFNHLFNSDTLFLIGKSFLLSGIVAFFAVLIGGANAFILYKFQFRTAGLYKLLLLIPLLVPPYVFAVAWKDSLFFLFGNNSDLNSAVAMILVHIMVFSPLAMLIIGSALTQINKGVEEAGLMSVSFGRMLRKIILPLIRPAVGLSFVLVFIFSLSDFSVPAFFGLRTFTTEIFTQFSAFYNFQLATGQSILLLLISLLLMLWEGKQLQDAPFFSIDTRGSEYKIYKLPNRLFGLKLIPVLVIIISSLLPLLILFFQSLSGKEHTFITAWNLISPTLISSISLAFMGAVLITLIGLWAAYMKERFSFGLPNTLLLITFIVPSTVLGMAEIGFFNRPATNFIYVSVIIILISYVGQFAFIASRIMGNGLRQIPKSLEEAAAVIGISPFRRFYKITLPLLFPSLFASFILAFVLSLGELGTVIMVYPPGTELMPIKLFTISANAPQALTSSITLINFLVSLGFIILFYFSAKLIFKKSANA
jgi:ABC-type Fe3+ transport system permease subunit